MNKRAVIAMSGGVDSSVSAFLIKQAGYDCIGVTMKLYNNYDTEEPSYKTCCSLSDTEDAKRVAYKLKIPYYVFNFTDEFEEKVIKKFVCSYENGITPNPCIDCNRHLKFDKLYNRARELGYDTIVTGHYANIEKSNGRYLLKKAKDLSKDQSYVLYNLSQDQLKHIIFPLGKYTKEETRKIAEFQGFINARKHDSQDICFVPNGNYKEFIRNYTGKNYPQGYFIDKDGHCLGEHKGIINYTIGQRKGLGISMKTPVFVTNINPVDNTVILGNNKDLLRTDFRAIDMNWIYCDKPPSHFYSKAKIRYSQEEKEAEVSIIDGGNACMITFCEPQRAITKGQSVVFYDGDTVLGGGIIV